MRSVVSALARRFRGRAVLQLENLAFRHQLHVLGRQRPGRPGLFTIDRLLGSWLYCLWPRCLDTMMLVKPATVIQWHPQGFRLYWLPHAEEAQKAPVCGMKAVTCGMAMNLRACPWKLSLALTLDPSAR